MCSITGVFAFMCLFLTVNDLIFFSLPSSLPLSLSSLLVCIFSASSFTVSKRWGGGGVIFFVCLLFVFVIPKGKEPSF